MIYTDREIKTKVNDLYRQCDALSLSDWERDFITDVAERDQEKFSDKQKEIIVRISDKHLD
jgi:hypothetical protein